MKVLIDTNIFISREQSKEVPENLAALESILKKNNVGIWVHPASINEIKIYGNIEARDIALSKIKAYPVLGNPPDFNQDSEFTSKFNISKEKSLTDNLLLYAVLRNAVDFLITEDGGVRGKAMVLDIRDRVLSVNEALNTILALFEEPKIRKPPMLESKYVYELSKDDPIFDTLREEYSPGFDDWFDRICKDHRRCWVSYTPDGKLGAVAIYKDEDEEVKIAPWPLPKKKRLKLATFKVVDNGYKIGELLIKISVRYCVEKNLDEIYLTHFVKPDDGLVQLISEYGFYNVGKKGNGEDVFLKRLVKNDSTDATPLEICKLYYPSFYDGTAVKKYVIPIMPAYHDKLFTDYPSRQTSLVEHLGGFITEGNTIKKAYLTQSKIKKLNPGDILLFYKSQHDQGLTAIGIIEQVTLRLNNRDEVLKHIGRRTVYSAREIDEGLKKGPVTVILFIFNCYFKNMIPRARLEELGIIAAPPQTIGGITDDKYVKVKEVGEVNGRYTIN